MWVYGYMGYTNVLFARKCCHVRSLRPNIIGIAQQLKRDLRARAVVSPFAIQQYIYIYLDVVQLLFFPHCEQFLALSIHSLGPIDFLCVGITSWGRYFSI